MRLHCLLRLLNLRPLLDVGRESQNSVTNVYKVGLHVEELTLDLEDVEIFVEGYVTELGRFPTGWHEIPSIWRGRKKETLDEVCFPQTWQDDGMPKEFLDEVTLPNYWMSKMHQIPCYEKPHNDRYEDRSLSVGRGSGPKTTPLTQRILDST
jgi:hypothetical protein